jgi:hypothetical protein
MILYFHSTKDERYHELSGDRPARKDGALGLLKDMKEGDDIEVFIESGWIPGWVCCQPNVFKFEIECVSFEDEKTVHGVIHDGLIKNYNARNSKLPWHKIIPPGKQCNSLPEESYVVIAREDRQADGTQGRYTLATRAVFKTEQEAKDYADGISSSREPMVIPGRFGQLRSPK